MKRAAVAALALAALAVAGCGNTVQSVPPPRGALETAMVVPYPVYWVGAEFRDMHIREVLRDPGGAVTIDYGDCLEGGQGACVSPLRIVTSPNNSFVPGGAGPLREIELRGVTAREMSGGSTLIVPTGPVVLDIYAENRRLAHAAAAAAVPLTEAAAFGQDLPEPSGTTAYSERPLKGQIPPLAAINQRRRRPRARRARRSSSASSHTGGHGRR